MKLQNLIFGQTTKILIWEKLIAKRGCYVFLTGNTGGIKEVKVSNLHMKGANFQPVRKSNQEVRMKATVEEITEGYLTGPFSYKYCKTEGFLGMAPKEVFERNIGGFRQIVTLNKDGNIVMFEEKP